MVAIVAHGANLPPVSHPHAQPAPAVSASVLTRSRRRALPSLAEQERRKAWGKLWGDVGAAYKRARLTREGR